MYPVRTEEAVLKSFLRGFLFLFLWILSESSSYPQVYSFRTYTAQDGLASNIVYTICQDARGYMWFGTSEGISIFDGQSFRNLTMREGLPDNAVHQIFEDRISPGTIWIITHNAHLCKWRDGSFTDITAQTRLHPEILGNVIQDHLGQLWSVSNLGIVQILGDSVRHAAPQIKSGTIFVGETRDGILWFVSDGCELTSYLPTTNQYHTYTVPVSEGSWIMSAYVDDNGSIFLTFFPEGYTYMYHDGHLLGRRKLKDHFLVSNSHKNVFKLGAGMGVVSENEFLTAPLLKFSTSNGLLSNDIRSGFIDRQGNLWFAAFPKGVAKLAAKHHVRFPLRPLIAYGHEVIASDSNNHIWAATACSLDEFWRDSSLTWHRYTHRFAKNDSVISVVVDSKNKLWIEAGGWKSHLEQFDLSVDQSGLNPTKLSRITRISLEQFKGSFSMGFIVDQHGGVWISFDRADHVWKYGGTLHVAPNRLKPIIREYRQIDGASENYVRNLYEDTHGNIWGQTYADGIIKLSAEDIARGKFRRYTTAEGLPDNDIRSLAGDRAGKVWVGTADNGVAVIDHDSIHTLSVREGLPSNRIGSIFEDRRGRVWVGTGLGFAVQERPGSSTFDRRDDLPQEHIPASGMTRNGILWFISGDYELYFYDTNSDTIPLIPPPTYIKELRVNGDVYPISRQLSFSYDENNIEVGFIGLSFEDEREVRYRYRLQGLDNRWNGPSKNHSVVYAHLDPGQYVFQVNAINASGVESALPATLAITIHPPVWRTWWFVSSAALLFVAIGPVIYYRRVAKLKLQKLEEELFSRRLIQSQEDERKRIAASLHDGLGQDLLIIKNKADLAILESSAGEDTGRYADIAGVASEAIEAARDIAHNLRPYQIDQLGLTKAIESITQRVSKSSTIAFSASIEDIDNLMTKESEINLYRIIQESVNNVLKHSGARTSAVRVRHEAHRLLVNVEDDGRGFNPREPGKNQQDQSGFGLKGIAERVKILRGEFSMHSSPGSGTKLTIEIPVGDTNTGSDK